MCVCVCVCVSMYLYIVACTTVVIIVFSVRDKICIVHKYVSIDLSICVILGRHKRLFNAR